MKSDPTSRLWIFGTDFAPMSHRSRFRNPDNRRFTPEPDASVWFPSTLWSIWRQFGSGIDATHVVPRSRPGQKSGPRSFNLSNRSCRSVKHSDWALLLGKLAQMMGDMESACLKESTFARFSKGVMDAISITFVQQRGFREPSPIFRECLLVNSKTMQKIFSTLKTGLELEEILDSLPISISIRSACAFFA
jgi:hypothetical protein